jgi:hypothetical protein
METTIKLQKGYEFESFIMDWFSKQKNINLSHYTLLKEQIEKGENRQGIEIKNDQRFTETGNLFISVERDYGYAKYESGIYKNQSWLYVIGNEDEFYIFAIKHLKQYYEFNKPALFNGFTSVKSGIDKGFLLSKKQAERICIEKVTKQTKLF